MQIVAHVLDVFRSQMSCVAGSNPGIEVRTGLADAASTNLTTFPAAASRARYARCISACGIGPPGFGGRPRRRFAGGIGVDGRAGSFFAMPQIIITVTDNQPLSAGWASAGWLRQPLAQRFGSLRQLADQCLVREAAVPGRGDQALQRRFCQRLRH
jgi:hypothetical protein